MREVLNGISFNKTTVYELSSVAVPKLHFILINPDGSDSDVVYDSFRDMLDEALTTTLGDVLRAEYHAAHGPRFDSDSWRDFCSDHFHEIAAQQGYRIINVIK
jgi:hypothetical protein